MTATATRIHTRWAIKRDLPGILAVDAKTGGAWTEESILEALRRRNCIGMVAEMGRGRHEHLGGFFVYELHRDSVKVLTFATLPGEGAEEVASAMWAKLLYKLDSHRRIHLELSALVRPEWRTADVRALCSADDMPYLPIFADALEDAGCSERWILDALREDGFEGRTLFGGMRRALS
jgi:hypothetical protein